MAHRDAGDRRVGTVWRSRHVALPVVYAIGLLLAAIRLALTGTSESAAFTIQDLTWAQAGSDLVIGPCLIAVLLMALRSRRGRLGVSDLLDGLAVFACAGLFAWVVVADHTWRSGSSLPLSIAAAGYVPVAALLLTFSIELFLEGLVRNTAMQLIVASSAVNLIGATVRSFVQIGALPSSAMVVATGTMVASLVLVCAGVGHPSVGRILISQRASVDRTPRETVRLAPVALALIPAVLVITVIQPTSVTDRSVRAIGALIVACALLARLYVSLERSAVAHERLVGRLDRDELTGLLTRQRFVRHMSESLDRYWRSEFQPTLIQINIDRFKNINDTLGHDNANRVLMMVAERLRLTAESFGGLVGRSSGDDFVVIDSSTRSASDASDRVEQFRDAFRRSYVVGDQSVFVTASIGFVVVPANRTITAEEMMRRADIATHRAKAEGRNRAQMFDDSMQSRLERRMDAEHALHGAIGRREMHLYHQPIVDIVDGRLSGFEALMRWRRTDGTMVSPADFIPIAEETGIICELGAWALEEALGALRRWIDDGVVPPTTTMSVNVSPIQIADPHFADVVATAIERSNVPAHLLWIEVTESTMLEEPELAQSTLRRIRSMGVRLALDDFGTGYSSLSLLQQFPIQRIKIDRAFVQGLAERNNDRSLVRTIIAMAQSMGLDLVAEGVETMGQLEALRDLGCDKAQGYMISRPVPAEAMRSTMVAISELTALSVFGTRPTATDEHVLDLSPLHLLEHADRVVMADEWLHPALVPHSARLLAHPSS